MRKALCLLLVLFLAAGIFPFAAVSRAEESEEEFYSYDFDLTFRLDAEAFPARMRGRMRGYAELIDMLEFKGTVSWVPSTEAVDMNANLFFIDTPDASISFRLFGVPSQLCLSSPLLGSETVFFNNSGLMEFVVKARNTLGISFQHLAVLIPYVTRFAFRRLTNSWDEIIGPVGKSAKISAETLKKLAAAWTDNVNSNSLNLWLTAMGEDIPTYKTLQQEFANLPSYLLDQVSGGRALRVETSGNSSVWKNAAGETLFSSTEEEGSYTMSFTLPATDNGYLPYLSVSSRSDEAGASLKVSASYLRSDEERGESFEYGDDDWLEPDEELDYEYLMPDSIFDIAFSADGLPVSWPSDTACSASLLCTGTMTPNLALTLSATGKSDGTFVIDICKPFTEGTEPVRILEITGTVTPSENKTKPEFSPDFFTGYDNVFSFNDSRLEAFTAAVMRPLVLGSIRFAAEIPASAYQSLLDDLTDIGILEMILDQ